MQTQILRLTITSRNFKVSNWDILEFRRQKFEIRTKISKYFGLRNPEPKNTELSNKIIWYLIVAGFRW